MSGWRANASAIVLLVNVVKGIGRQVVIDLNGEGIIERKYEYKKI
jgi:hypothetical protein